MFLLLLLTGRNDAPLADTFPDPAGRDSPGLAVLLGLGQRVRGAGGLVVLDQVAVVRHEVAPQFVRVLHGHGQEELHAAEDVHQRLVVSGLQPLRRGLRARLPVAVGDALALLHLQVNGRRVSSAPEHERHGFRLPPRDSYCTFLAEVASGAGVRG